MKKALQVVVPLLFLFITQICLGQYGSSPASLPDLSFHLTARPWTPLNIQRSEYLDAVEGIVHQVAKFQNSDGAIIDPYTNKEEQYSTPYFAYAVATLVSAGRSTDLLEKGIKAMDKATNDVSKGLKSIPDSHGNFFIASIAGAIPLYETHVSASKIKIWKARMSGKISELTTDYDTNWRTYAMKGEWFRVTQGLVPRNTELKDQGVGWIEKNWLKEQKGRLKGNFWNFYLDGTSDPDTWAYENAARGNLLSMLYAGYDGPSREDMLNLLGRATKASFFSMDPSGLAAAGGRSGNHTWNDIVQANAFESLAEIWKDEDRYLAGQFRRAAALNFLSAQRFKRSDGTYSVTRNHFDPKLRIGYAKYSFLTNYNGYMMFHMSENYNRHLSSIAEQPVPVEIGGYVLVTDKNLASAFANAGGMQLQANLRGATKNEYGSSWTTLGVVRFGRVGWDSRLGPFDGTKILAKDKGISFAPTFFENGKWQRLASLPDRYEGEVVTEFTHPLLVKLKIIYKPKEGKSGPVFTNHFTITPDGIFSSITSTAEKFGVTWPVLTFDGKTTLQNNFSSNIVQVSFPGNADEQNYISVQENTIIETTEAPERGTTGDVRPVRMISNDKENITFIYPRTAEDPEAEKVRQSFKKSGKDFSSILAVVKGNLYIGRTSAGGEGDKVDISGDGAPDAVFSKKCHFVLQIKAGKITKVEVDREVTASIQGQNVILTPFSPLSLDDTKKVNEVKLKVHNHENIYKVGDDVVFETEVYPLSFLSKVEYFSDNVKIGESKETPFTFKWKVVKPGNQNITAKAVYKTGTSIISKPVDLQVKDNETETRIVDNLALNKSVTFSNQKEGSAALNISDGDLSNKWAAYKWPQWVQVDLGEEFNINKTEVAPHLNRAYKYKIEISLDGVEYTSLVDKTSKNSESALFADNFPSVKARYVKLTVTGASGYNEKWVAINEFRVFGENLALNKAITFSSQQEGNEAFKIVDGNDSLRWAAKGWPEWVEVDLGESYIIKQTEILPYMNRAYKYNIEASEDGIKYTTIVDKSKNQIGGAILADKFSPIEARYIRLKVTGATDYKLGWVSLYEFRVFGTVPAIGSSIVKKSAVKQTVNLEESSTSSQIEFLIYPNPESKNVKIRYFSEVDSEVKISIFDISGKNHSEKIYKVNYGTNVIDFDLVNGLTKGFYIVNLVTSDGKILKKKFIKK